MPATPRELIVIDNEAVQALRSTAHPKHRTVMPYVRVVDSRRRRSPSNVAVEVPSTVRAEAGWDRTDPGWALANRFRVVDRALDESLGNVAAAIRSRLGPSVSVVDAHVGAVVQAADAERITVITSDPKDMAAVAEDTPVVIVAI